MNKLRKIIEIPYKMTNMKIAFIGTQGIPASYGGAETAVQEIGLKLVEYGHSVSVYGKSDKKMYKYNKHKKIPVHRFKGLKIKSLDYPFRRFISTLHAIAKKYDILHYYGNDGGLYSMIPRLIGKNIVITFDGMEWDRESYPLLVQKVLKGTLYCSFAAASKIVVDSLSIKNYLKSRYGIETTFIPYGAKIKTKFDRSVLRKYGLKEKEYFLFVGRFVKEKGVHLLINAFNQANTNKKLAIIGSDPYHTGYENALRDLASDKILFLGSIYGSEYETLKMGSYCYVSASMLEGSSPSLIQAMGFGLPSIVSDIKQNKEVLGKCGLYFKNKNVQDLKDKIEYLSEKQELADKFGECGIKRVKKRYSWDTISKKHEELYMNILKK